MKAVSNKEWRIWLEWLLGAVVLGFITVVAVVNLLDTVNTCLLIILFTSFLIISGWNRYIETNSK